MIDSEVHEIIYEAVDGYVTENEVTLVNAIIGAVATSGFAIVKVDAEVMRRVLAEMYKMS